MSRLIPVALEDVGSTRAWSRRGAQYKPFDSRPQKGWTRFRAIDKIGDCVQVLIRDPHWGSEWRCYYTWQIIPIT